MPRYYIDSDPGKISPRIVSLPITAPSLRVLAQALSSELGVTVHDVVRVELPDARDGHESFYFWQAKAVGAVVTVMPIRTVRHLLEDGVAQRAGTGKGKKGKGRSAGESPALVAGEPVEVLTTWASGGRTGKNSKAWFGGYHYVAERAVRGERRFVVRHGRGSAFAGQDVLVPPELVRRPMALGAARSSW